MCNPIKHLEVEQHLSKACAIRQLFMTFHTQVTIETRLYDAFDTLSQALAASCYL